MTQFNQLTPAESERLYLLLEELGEAQQAIGKVLRHGYESCHPDRTDNNRFDLQTECGHVRHAMIRLCEAGDLSKAGVHQSADDKRLTVNKYLHHQGENDEINT